jgi:hypothetical protein
MKQTLIAVVFVVPLVLKANNATLMMTATLVPVKKEFAVSTHTCHIRSNLFDTL